MCDRDFDNKFTVIFCRNLGAFSRNLGRSVGNIGKHCGEKRKEI